jgi:hypothetical protein
VKAWLRRDSVAFGLDLDDGSGLAPQAPGTYSLPNSALKKLAPFRRSIAF